MERLKVITVPSTDLENPDRLQRPFERQEDCLRRHEIYMWREKVEAT